MTELNTLEDAFMEEVRDLYSAETQVAKDLPKLAKKVTSPRLKKALENHAKETKDQIARIEKVGKMFDFKLTGKKCAAMEGLIAESNEILEQKSSDPMLIDALLIGACQRVEHYEMAGYGTARTMAEQLGYTDAAELLQQTLDQEKATDEILTRISEEEVLPSLSTGD